MERNRNWLGWAALALAGLALLVALGGRGPFAFGERVVAVQAPAAPAAPAAPDFGPRFGRGGPEVGADVGRHIAEMEQRMARAHGGFEHGPGFGRGFEHGRGWGFPLFGLLRGLVNLAALGMLAYLLLTIWRQRRGGPAAPAAPTTPAGHDPRVE